MRDRLRKHIYTFFAKPFIERRIKKRTHFSYAGLDLVVYPGVFHPAYFFSTKFFADFIYEENFEGKTFCEVGCGSGLISLLAYKNKARVLALDIHTGAIKNLSENLELNFGYAAHPEFKIVESDLFDAVEPCKLDYVFINPPWFFKEARTNEEKAWNCGENGAYFDKLFQQLPSYTEFMSTVWMALGDSADVKRIKEMAKKYGFEMQLVYKKKVKWEWNFVYRLDKN